MKSKVNVFGQNLYLSRIEDFNKVAQIIFCVDGQVIPEIDDESLPLIVLASGKINQAMKIAKKINPEAIHIVDWMKRYPKKYGDLEFNKDGAKFFSENEIVLQKIMDNLTDIKSRNLYERIWNFRSTYSRDFIDGLIDCQTEQYFEDFLPKKYSSQFLDVGVYDCSTSNMFRKKYGTGNEIVLFEPDKNNISQFNELYAALPNSRLIQKGLSNLKQTLRFKSNGSASTVSDDGDIEIEVVPLDYLPKITPSLIKIDIEGGELEALKGARGTIEKHRPVLAIACYHSPQQFIDVPKYIIENTSNYNYYFRHYTESIYESVFFAVPA